jgi:predicted dehydrogenase
MTQPKAARANSPNDRIRVAVMGLSRGMSHIDTYGKIAGVEIAYVCDVDRRRLASGAKRAAEGQRLAPQAVEDVRRILDDPDVDALSIAAPNFWHAPATIMACAAGKHVYVEKPGSHNPYESELMVEAARKHNRQVQMGVQRRSMPHYMEAVRRLRDGAVGTLRYARCWYDNARGSIGVGRRTEVPTWLNYELWQGPIPETPYKDNLVHYNWHWHWKWGNGELGNNGIHALDVARWGLNVDLPQKVNYAGGRYHFADDQETPDTGYATYDFGHCGICWDQSSCLPRRPERLAFVTFYGDDGTLAIQDNGFVIYDEKGTEVAREQGNSNQQPHFQNFIDAIREGVPLNAAIADGQRSTMLCHFGNIAYRLNCVVDVDGQTGKIHNNRQADELWRPAYRPGWEPTV